MLTCMFISCVINYKSYVEERLACILLLYQYHNIYCLVSYAMLYIMACIAKSPRSVTDAPRTCPRSSRAVCLAERPHEAPVSRLQCHPRPRARSTEPKRLKTQKFYSFCNVRVFLWTITLNSRVMFKKYCTNHFDQKYDKTVQKYMSYIKSTVNNKVSAYLL